MNFIEHWHRHLDFLRSSAASYDQGARHEAIRVSTSLRVMFHNTKNSTSLLAHLGRRTALVLDTFGPDEPLVPGGKMLLIEKMLVRMGGPDGVRIDAPLGRTPERHRWLRAPLWWDQVVSVHGDMALSRCQVVLSAANQDGGAHVDSKPSSQTTALKKGFYKAGKFVRGQPQEPDRELDNYHFPLLRQFAYEVLNSPELTAIC